MNSDYPGRSAEMLRTAMTTLVFGTPGLFAAAERVISTTAAEIVLDDYRDDVSVAGKAWFDAATAVIHFHSGEAGWDELRTAYANLPPCEAWGA
jgi:hypothetical protein